MDEPSDCTGTAEAPRSRKVCKRDGRREPDLRRRRRVPGRQPIPRSPGGRGGARARGPHIAHSRAAPAPQSPPGPALRPPVDFSGDDMASGAACTAVKVRSPYKLRMGHPCRVPSRPSVGAAPPGCVPSPSAPLPRPSREGQGRGTPMSPAFEVVCIRGPSGGNRGSDGEWGDGGGHCAPLPPS